MSRLVTGLWRHNRVKARPFFDWVRVRSVAPAADVTISTEPDLRAPETV
jgi:hypothetical protein